MLSNHRDLSRKPVETISDCPYSPIEIIEAAAYAVEASGNRAKAPIEGLS
jgi:hypothetical protein